MALVIVLAPLAAYPKKAVKGLLTITNNLFILKRYFAVKFSLNCSSYFKASANYRSSKDILPVSLIACAQRFIVSHPNTGANPLQAFVSLLKKKPGEFAYGSSGIGRTYHHPEVIKTFHTAVIDPVGAGPGRIRQGDRARADVQGRQGHRSIDLFVIHDITTR
jgi:hypothetical protein